MYLRTRDYIDRPVTKTAEQDNFLQVLFFIIVMFLALLLSSVTVSGTKPAGLADSLNSNSVIYFDFGKYELNEACLDLLEHLAQRLKFDRSAKIDITGHTDNIGSISFNTELSIKRVEAVKAFLIRHGANEDQVIIHGEGFSKPITDNNTDENRALNRRVEFKWMPQKTKEAITEDESFANTGSWKINGNEIVGNLSLRDSSGEPVTEITEEDVSAVLKWRQNETEDSSDGRVKLFPIDDKKKIAFTFTMDYSGSMFDESQLRFPKKTASVIQMEKAVYTFIDNMDPVFYGRIIKFGVEIRELVKYTKSKNALREAVVNYSENLYGTALFKSIWFALKDTTFNSNPTIIKTVVAFTDGEENSSGNIGKINIYQESEKSGVRVYTVGLLDKSKHSVPAGLNTTDEADLVEIAKNTGGFYYWAHDPVFLPVIYRQIYDQIMKSFNISIVWNGDKLPPKGTPVTALIRVNVKGIMRTMYKKYVME